MALTRPNLENILTNVVMFTDSMTVLHAGATQANVDVGFLMNRANGLVPNAAFYWSESTQSFVTALTANAGTNSSNITVQSYANITAGSITGTLTTASQPNITTLSGLTTIGGSTLTISGPTTHSSTVSATAFYAPTIGNTGASLTGSTASISTWANIAGPLVVNNNTAVQAIQVVGTSTKGGTGYHDFLLATNQGGGTNPNKSFRLDSLGTFQIINSAYTATIFSLTDGGVLGGFNQISVGGSTGSSGQILSSTGTGLQWTAAGGFSGGSVPNQTTFASNLVASSGTASTSNTTGALVVQGGTGITGNLYVGGNFVVTGTQTTVNTETVNTTEYVATINATNVYASTIGNTGATLTGTLSTAAQTNITSVGTLTGLTLSGALTQSSTTASAVTSVLTHGADVNFQLTAQNGVSTNTTGAEVARFGINYNTAGWDSFTQYIRGSAAQTGNQVLWAANTAIATVSTSGVTLSTGSFSGAGTGLTGTASSLSIGGSAPAGSLTGSTLASGVTASSLTSVGTLASLTVSGAGNMPSHYINRSASAATGINWYSSTYGFGSSWTDYMSPANQTGCGPTANITAPTGTLVTSWGLRRFIENSPGYGWTFESGTSTTTTPTVVAEIRSSDGAARFAGSVSVAGLVSSAAVTPSANASVTLGSTTAWWSTVYGTAIHAQYADLAENYTADTDYAPGTVVVFGGDAEITITTQSHDPRVAGVISTNPAYLMNGSTPGLPVAMTGRVPCQVQGPVTKGQVLVTSTTAGVAKAINNSQFVPGCVVGKALEAINTNTIETIEVVVGRF